MWQRQKELLKLQSAKKSKTRIRKNSARMLLKQNFWLLKNNVTVTCKLLLKSSNKNLKPKMRLKMNGKQWSDSDITYIHTRTGFEFCVNKLIQFLLTI